MKTAVVFYSWSGHTRAKANLRAAAEQATLFEIRDRHKPSALSAFTRGCFAALRMKPTPTAPFDAPLQEYGRIVIMAPVWAGGPAPAIYGVFDALPKGKQVVVVLVSGSGASKCQAKVEALVRSKGCDLVGFENTKG